ncbi:MAG: prepilin-type N-terminal cleavage/methylation domain-containing protein [Phycisphaerales bacterium]
MRAFTLVELMVGLMVTSVILSAVATLAFAMSHASTAGGDYAHTQAQIRRATVYVSDLITRCRLICAAPGDDLAIWKSDDNGNGRLNLNELVYLERGSTHQYLRLCAFASVANPEIDLDDLTSTTTKTQFVSNYGGNYTALIPECNEAQFSFLDGAPPATGSLAITFEFEENNATRQCEIVATARCRAAHLLNAAGDALVTTDDD